MQIDIEHRRRLLVDRHLLAVDRSTTSTLEVANALSMLHSTDPSTPYLSIHARSEAGVDDVADAFYVSRSLLRHTTIRRTVFAIPVDIAPLPHGAFNGPLVQKLRKQLARWIDESPDTDMPGAKYLSGMEREVLDALATSGAATGAELSKLVPGLQLTFNPAPTKSYSKPQRITSKVLEILAADGQVARGRPTGKDFTSAAWTWELSGSWTGGDRIEVLDQSEALAGLLSRYLSSFGPATVTDMAWWTGLAKGKIKAAVDQMNARSVGLAHCDELGYALSDDDLEAPDAAGSVALLPGLDSTTMGWKQRSWYVDDNVSAGLFDRNGNAGPTVLVDGRVVGAWNQRPSGEVVMELLHDVGSDATTALDNEADRVSRWLGDIRVKWRFPTALSKKLAK